VNTLSSTAEDVLPAMSQVPSMASPMLRKATLVTGRMDAVNTVRDPKATTIEKTLAVGGLMDRTGITTSAKDTLGAIREGDMFKASANMITFVSGTALAVVKPRDPKAMAVIAMARGAIALAPAVNEALNGPSGKHA
jgi:hypothetical protein